MQGDALPRGKFQPPCDYWHSVPRWLRVTYPPRCHPSHGEHAWKTCSFPFEAYKIVCFPSCKYNALPRGINTFSKLSRFQTHPNYETLLDSTIKKKAATWGFLRTILFKT